MRSMQAGAKGVNAGIGNVEQRTITVLTRRLVPLLVLCYFVAYLDRVNISFAALTMNRDLGLSSAAFGLGAGLFFIPYFLFEVPSNLILARMGARRWIARIMFSWGIVSACMALVSGATGFYALRVLLGIAEAGFFPGIVFYLTLWFPQQYRAHITGLFMVAAPLSTVVGAPLSALLLGLDGLLGLHGWQWLFVIEAIPAVLLSFVVWRYLPDSPAQASWLNAESRTWLTRTLDDEVRAVASRASLLSVLFHPRVTLLSAIYFGAAATNYGLSFFLPQIVKEFGFSILATGLISAFPYAAAVVAMVLWSRHSDHTGERRLHTAIPLALAALGLLFSTLSSDPLARIAALTLAGIGIFSGLPVFWTMPSAMVSGSAAAGAIAFINAVGNLAGFAGPYAMGWIHGQTGDYRAGLRLLALAGFLVAALVMTISRKNAVST